ncbi:DUF3558 family protein [Corynebacterium lujinxingii]|uniref:DUF3558 family protein n=1 Tax=Corynebacterium lujinxingii TaxID=2763010 RepID=A0A7H0K0N5_9CORY|nr:DUF3558 family protein [Corynebacterium lujinxingii]MBC3179405.1 DUF3558 family protein [Corynebacterium lujinxingii]NNO11510.1 DUF3558 domain-containing protein [Corynebacterium lujinxingii]QNP90851.1 DUF3558 family protein [Corynebacterium lujinxingii]
MKRLAAVAMCVLLTGCAEQSLIDDPTSPPTSAPATDADSGSQAFVFDSGVLEIGDFDLYTLGDDLFDPCTEITAEEFAAAGFDNVEPMPEEYAGLARGLSSCSFTKHPQVPSEVFGNTNASKKDVEAEVDLLTEYGSQALPSLFVYGPRGGIGTGCYAQVDTGRGGLVSEVGGADGFHRQETTCQIAIENLENLHAAHSR